MEVLNTLAEIWDRCTQTGTSVFFPSMAFWPCNFSIVSSRRHINTIIHNHNNLVHLLYIARADGIRCTDATVSLSGSLYVRDNQTFCSELKRPQVRSVGTTETGGFGITAACAGSTASWPEIRSTIMSSSSSYKPAKLPRPTTPPGVPPPEGKLHCASFRLVRVRRPSTVHNMQL